MRITRLRLSGFKSFVEPTELRIEPGLTGVVGPNGCGKSNLLEAIRWVMGESSAKSMRGGGMEDVIFAGTETRPSRGFAEVTLVCEIDGAPLPGLIRDEGGDTLEVVRRIERGVGSAYRANGQDVRAKDIALVFADAATGAHSPALVSQGKVAAIIGARPQERRQLLEEAAGIAGLHVRRKDAEQKLRATEGNLVRLSEMLETMGTRAGALRRQARAAERYTALSADIRVAEGRMIYARWRDAAAEAQAAKAEAAAAAEGVEQTTAAQTAAAEAQAAGVAALAAARDLTAKERENEHALAGRIVQLESEHHNLTRRIADLAQEHDRIARDREAEDALAREGAAAMERLEAVIADTTGQLSMLDKDRPGLEAQISSAADMLRDADVALAQAQAEAANESAERRIAQAALEEAQRRRDRIGAEQAKLTRERDAAGDGATLTEESQRATAATVAGAQAVADAETAVQTLISGQDDLRADGAAAETALSEARSALTALESELDALERSLKASAGKGARLLDRVKPQPGFEAALAAALADEINAPVLDAGAAADSAVDSSADGVRGWRGAPRQADDPALPSGVIALADVVEFPPALARRMAQIGVVDADIGQPLAVGQRLVTREGVLRRWDGFVSHGEGAATAERMMRINRRDALAQALPALRAARDAATTTAEAAQAAMRAHDASLQTARRQQTEAEEAVRRYRRAADQAEAALERHSATMRHIAERAATVEADAAEAAAAMAAAAERLTALPDGAVTAARVQDCNAAASSARATMHRLREALGALDRDLARLRETQIEAQAEMRGWKARAGEAVRRITAMKQRSEAVAEEQAVLAGKPEAAALSLSHAQHERDSVRARVAEAAETERAAAEAMRGLEAALEATREALSTAREARAGAMARAEHADQRRVEMGRISGERFSCPPPVLPNTAGFDDATVTTPQAESAAHEKLTLERERIGPVNLVAAQELAELEGEQATVAHEVEELTQAVNRLRGSIGHLNREGRARLLQAFEQVDGHFQRLFATLFGGGQAHLALVDADDPLEAGLEIMAQPPGKKLSSLTLLSGGEQALTAIALIFALFLTNPAPICVLDEVDAPLDDANVERFCDLLERMTQETDTRYLIVTHNAVTMSRMHRLFGVTMVERGISRLVSVDLGGAKALLAAE